jgi:hypothetical protein
MNICAARNGHRIQAGQDVAFVEIGLHGDLKLGRLLPLRICNGDVVDRLEMCPN